MKLGGGTANQMRALGYKVLPPDPASESTCWRMITPRDPNLEKLAANQEEGWKLAEKDWYSQAYKPLIVNADHRRDHVDYAKLAKKCRGEARFLAATGLDASAAVLKEAANALEALDRSHD